MNLTKLFPLLCCFAALAQQPSVRMLPGHTNMAEFLVSPDMATARTHLGVTGSAGTNVLNFIDSYAPAADGITDDGAKLSSAIDAANSSGRVLYIPKGRYAVNTAFTKTGLTNLTIVGDGPYASIITCTNYTGLSDTIGERITNGSFSTDLNTWSGVNWAWEAGGKARHTAGATNALVQAITLDEINYTRLKFQVSGRTAGSLTVWFGVTATPLERFTATTNGWYFLNTIPTGVGSTLHMLPTTDFDGALESVSVGAGTTIGTQDLITFVNCSNLRFERLGFDGDGTGAGSVYPWLNASNPLTFSSTTGSTNLVVKDCRFTNWRKGGIETRGSVTASGFGYQFLDNLFQNMQTDTNVCNGGSIQIGRTDGALIRGNNFINCGANGVASHAIYAHGTANPSLGMRIVDNYFVSRNTDMGYASDGYSSYRNSQVKLGNDFGTIVSRNLFHGVTLLSNGGNAVWDGNTLTNSALILGYAGNQAAINNRFYASTNSIAFITSNGTITNGLVRGNLFEVLNSGWNAATDAYAVQGAQHSWTIEDNVVHGMGIVYVGAMTNVSIRRNQGYFQSSTKFGIRFDGGGTGSAYIDDNTLVYGNYAIYNNAGNVLSYKGNKVYLGTVSGLTPVTQTIVDASSTITPVPYADVITLNVPDGTSTTLTSAPTIANGTFTNQLLLLRCANTETGSVVLQDEATLAGSNLRFPATSRTLNKFATLGLIWDGAEWCETSYNDGTP